MLLAYNPERAATRDIDALFTPTPDDHRDPGDRGGARLAIHMVEQPSGRLCPRTPGEGQRVFDHPHLQVMVTPPDHLLAMKVLAARAVRDSDDLKVLFDHVGITTPNEGWPIVERFFPGTAIPVRARGLVEDLLED